MYISLTAFILFLSLSTGCNPPSENKSSFREAERKLIEANIPDTNPPSSIEDTRKKAKEALTYCRSKGMNEAFCILIDMKIHSGRNRFFVWDFTKDTISHSFLVGHGCCNNPWSGDYSKEKSVFSNTGESHCSSLGKYKIGKRGYSSWGVNVKYLLHGLEPSNSNALKRIIVFHSWEAVSDEEIYPRGTPEGWGCPTISNNNFREIDPLLMNTQKPVLMWIYSD